jgi:hypothetical protein
MRNQPFIVAVTVFAAIVFIATTTTFYQRETTSIEAKYIGRSSTEIDALYHTSYLQVPGDNFASTINEDDGSYSDNIKTNRKAVLAMDLNNNLHMGIGNDWDGDGLSNGEEESLGEDGFITESDNPDTDGDGIIDSQDVDPLDPTKGGAIIPVYPGLGGDGGQQDGELVITNFYKAACNPNLTGGICDKNQPDHWATPTARASIGHVLRFKIHVELQNNSIFNKYINLFDNLPNELFYYPGSAEVQINDSPPYQLTGDDDLWLKDPYEAYRLSIGARQTKTYNFWFNAKILDLPATNTAALWSNVFLKDTSILIDKLIP